MARYRMSDGTVIDTDNATKHWKEDSWHDGNNRISRATGTQWDHERLHRSRRGRYYVERWSQWQGSHPSAEWVSEQEATRWLLLNEHDLPEDLAEHESEVSE